MKTKLVAINILTNSPKRLADFYKNILGAEIDETHGGPDRIEIWFGDRNDNAVFIVVNRFDAFKPQKANCLRGFELRVKDANAEYNRIMNLGINIKEPPKDLPWGYRYFCVADPDGNEIDIVEQLSLND